MGEIRYSLLIPEGEYTYRTLDPVVMHDLGLDMICRQLSAKEAEQNYIMNVMSRMYVDPEVTSYRCGVFDDIIRNKKLRDDMMAVLGRISFLKDYGSFKRDYDEASGIWDLMHRLDEIGDYIDCVDSLYACLKDQQLNSEGFSNLRNYVEQIYCDNGFGELKKDIAELKKLSGEVKSITIGINLNSRYEADGVGLISVNSRQFTRGGVLSNFYGHLMSKDRLNDELEGKQDYKFQPIDAANEAVSKMQENVQGRFVPMMPAVTPGMTGIPDSDKSKDITRYTDKVATKLITRIVKKLRETLNKYVSITITDMTDLIPELMYYIRWAEYIEKIQRQGAVFSRAKVVCNDKITPGMCENVNDRDAMTVQRSENVNDQDEPAAQHRENAAYEYRMKARGVYNIKLAAFDTEEAQNIVTNDLDFDEEHRVYILTGANRGGKTTITQTIGQLFVLAQGGIYIPGDGFEFAPVDCIFTHFPADEDKTLDLGRLGEECKRFREIYDSASEKSLILLNETFSTTSFEEGYYIAKNSVRAILAKGTRTIYNTHMHKLGFDVDEMNEGGTNGKVYSLVVHNEGSKRSYKIELAPPAGKSFASDIAEKYGVTYEQLVSGREG